MDEIAGAPGARRRPDRCLGGRDGQRGGGTGRGAALPPALALGRLRLGASDIVGRGAGAGGREPGRAWRLRPGDAGLRRSAGRRRCCPRRSSRTCWLANLPYLTTRRGGDRQRQPRATSRARAGRRRRRPGPACGGCWRFCRLAWRRVGWRCSRSARGRRSGACAGSLTLPTGGRCLRPPRPGRHRARHPVPARVTERLPADEAGIAAAAALLRNGQLVAFPTDTVYGVACATAHPEAVDAIYALKRRPHGSADPDPGRWAWSPSAPSGGRTLAHSAWQMPSGRAR